MKPTLRRKRASRIQLRLESRDLQNKKRGRNPMPALVGLFNHRERQRDRDPGHGILPCPFEKPRFAGEYLRSLGAE